MNIFDWFAKKPGGEVAPGSGFADPKPKTNANQTPQGEIVSIERPQFGMYGESFPRVNLDKLVGKQGLEVYARMRVDEQVKAAVTFKRDAIVSRGWTFEFPQESKLAETEKELRVKVFEKVVTELDMGFVDALNVISTGREFGYSITEKVYGQVEVDGKAYAGLEALLGRDPCTFDFYTDPYGRLVKVEQQAAGKRIKIDLAKFVHYVHNPEFDYYYGRSDLREAYRSWYFKETMLKYWALYMEKLGGGMLIARLTDKSQIAYNSPQYNALVATLASVKASPSILLPIGVEAEVVFPSSTDAYEKACTWHDGQIAKSLLVPNLAGVSHTGETGSYSQAQVQLESFAWTLQADTKRLESCVDKQIFRDLGAQNWDDGEYPCFKFKPLSDAKMQAMVETWVKLVSAGTVLATEQDEERLREILEMPPRDAKAKPLAGPEVDPEHAKSKDAAEQGNQLAKDKAEHAFDLSEKGKDADIERQAQAAADAEQDPKKKKLAYARAKLQATLYFWPDKTGHDDHGREPGTGNNDAILSKMSPELRKAVDRQISRGKSVEDALRAVTDARTVTGEAWAEAYKHLGGILKEREDADAKEGIAKDAKSAKVDQVYRDRSGGWSIKGTRGDARIDRGLVVKDGQRQGRVTSVNPGTRTARVDWDNRYDQDVPIKDFGKYGVVGYDSESDFKRFSAPTLRDARVASASARERVDFAVIERKSSKIAMDAASDVSSVIAKFTKGMLGDDKNVAELTDQDMRDIANIELPGLARGRIKTHFIRALAEAWALGRTQAREELRRVGRAEHISKVARFADLRDQAADYFEAQGFRMAGNASDGARAVIQAELINSVKNGRSPPQTRTAIWERLTAKGFSSREAVRSVETDEGVLRALDELWVDDEEQAAHYLDTLARTNIFESMNEARYAEFTDPALDGFVVAFRFSSILDDRTTEVCEHMHDRIYKADDEVWDEYRPPLHYNCRSILVPITAVDVQDGVWDGTESEEPTVDPQAGFGA